jgi:flagellum-specific peptidoglycan hydrolase FlgJ
MAYLTRKEWINKNAADVKEITSGTGIFPETLMAIAIVESQGKFNGVFYPGAGQLARLGNNFFGIKKGVGWKGPTIKLNTPNDADKVSIFRKYGSFKESADDFVNFLQKNPRYKNAGVFKADDYVAQIIAIAKAGYAESPSYREVITKVAASVKNQIDKIIAPLKKNSKILPFLVAGVIITFFFVNKKLNHANN